jgi:arginase family enzyme
VGSAVLQAVLPPPDGPTLTVPVTMTDEGLAERDGVEAKTIVIEQLARALKIIRQLNPARIATLGGECSVSVAPFSALAGRYGDDLAIIWIDSHPDVGTGDSEYPATTRWRSRHSPGRVTLRCRRCFRRPSVLTVSPWSACTRGPTTTMRT